MNDFIDVNAEINNRTDFYIGGKLVKKKRKGRYLIEMHDNRIVEVCIRIRTVKKPAVESKRTEGLAGLFA